MLALAALLGGASCRRDVMSGLPKQPPPDAGSTVNEATSEAPIEPPIADAAQWASFADADYLMLGNRAWLPALAPLIAHRNAHGHRVAAIAIEDVYARLSNGAPDADALHGAIERLVAHTAGKLKFVLLAGDTAPPPEEGLSPLPTFYLQKLDYEHHKAGEHFLLGEHNHEEVVHTNQTYPSDRPFSIVAASKTKGLGVEPTRLAVGRIPARSKAQLRAFADKLVTYETSAPEGAWQRTLAVTAGPANYGPVVDGVIEGLANKLFDRDVSYDFDLRFTFAKLQSPYAYRFDQLQQKFVDDLDRGALIATYVGHGAASSFDDVYFHGKWYPIGDDHDAARVVIPTGQPLFFSFACDTGAFDRPDGKASLAEALILNEKGAIGVFASSRESHPYPNALYGQAVIAQFVNGRPATIGEGVLAMEAQVQGASIAGASLLIDTDEDALKEEHFGLYNLLGDPATRLRYPSAAGVVVTPLPSGKLSVAITASVPNAGTATVTLETKRSTIRGTLTPPSTLESMTTDAAFAAMAKNYALASDKVVATKEIAFQKGLGTGELAMPKAPGDYVIKVLLRGDGGVAIGHADLKVP